MNDHNQIQHIEYCLDKMAYDDILRAYEGKSHIGAFILICCFIDCMAGFRYGKKASKNEYLNFIKEYFDNEIYNPEQFYIDFRCGLIHNYTEGGTYILTFNNKMKHGKKESGRTWINLEDLIADCQKAKNRLFAGIESNNTIKRNALKRFSSGLLSPIKTDAAR